MTGEILRLPDTLYKYYKIDDRSLRLLSHDEIYFSNPLLHFNDPFDCRLPLDYSGGLQDWEKKLKAIYRERKIRKNAKAIKKDALTALNSSKNTPDLLANADLELIKDVGIFCLTEIPDDILMLSHYADHHKGMCVGFKADQYVAFAGFYADISSRYTAPIKYTDTYYPPKYLKASNQEKMDWTLFTKAKDWEYEHEWRVVDRNGFGVRRIYPRMLKEIFLGCQTCKGNEEKLLTLVRGRKEEIPVYRYRKIKNEFSFSRQIIN